MDNIPCKYEEHWAENQSPLGSGLYWPEQFSGCGYEGEIDLEGAEKCDPSCRAYIPMEIEICGKHGEFIAEYGCTHCEADEYEKFIEAERSESI